MDFQEEILEFLDLLDLDEEIIDTRLKTLMVRSTHTNKHLKSAIQLLQYKNLINTQEHSECDNDNEFDFTVQLLRNIDSKNVDYVCKIINIVLCLNTDKLTNKSEHLIQQILLNIDFQTDKSDSYALEIETYSKTLINLKVCGSILDAIIKKNQKLSLPFLETPLEKILNSTDEKLKIYFLTSTVPRLFEGVVGYNILDRIWHYIKQLKGEHKEKALKTLSCLSEYYLPIPDAKGNIKYESEIVYLFEFWDIILFGIASDDTGLRKISVYLSKRAIDCVVSSKKDVSIQCELQNIFIWSKQNSKNLKVMWDNYFVLIDSLDEKQSNIVLPSLKLFETIDVGECWLNAAFNIGLKHDNTQVRLKCIEYRLKKKIRSHSEAITLLEAFNDINIYDTNTNYEVLKANMQTLLVDLTSFMVIFKAIPQVKWSPVPFYHITDMLGNLEIEIPFNNININDIFKVPCNNLVIRKGVCIKLLFFIHKCCHGLNWKDLANIVSAAHFDSQISNLFLYIARKIKLSNDEVKQCFEILSTNITNLDLICFYLSDEEYLNSKSQQHNSIENEECLNTFVDIINEKKAKIDAVVNRQYSNKKECLNDVIFLIHLLSKTKDTKKELLNDLHKVIAKQNKAILQYILGLFSSDACLTIEDIATLLEKHNYEFLAPDLADILLQLYKTSVLFLKDRPELDKAVLSIFTLKLLLRNQVLNNKYKHEMLNLKRFLDIISNFKFKNVQNESAGRLKNAFYEKSCEILYLLTEEHDVKSCMNELVKYIENVLECGGYGCLRWILKTVNKIVKPLINEKAFNMNQFINRARNEIEELKSNNQYSPCIEQFIELITQDAILENAMYNNIVILYSNKIIEYGPIKTNPLYYLIRNLNRKGVKDYGHLVYILCEILLYSPVSRKDQRIADNVTLQILQDYQFESQKSHDIHFNFEIQYLSIATLCHINDAETLNILTKFITNRIDETFRNKQRYHGNSQAHKVLLTSLQHILIITLKSTEDMDWLLNWSLDLLVKLPHQPSVRIALEWLVSLYLYKKKINISEEILQTLQSKNLPLTSQFFVIYWLLKHKISLNNYTDDEYNFVLDFLLSHTMGQLFNVRLHAQYLATELHKSCEKTSKFDYTIAVIEKTFCESKNDKNFVKLKGDYFTNKFDLVVDLNPYFIYYLLPRYCEMENDKVDFNFIKNILWGINNSLVCGEDDFKREWMSYRTEDQEFIEIESSKIAENNATEDGEAMGTIQKKYIPWKNMSDINVYDVEKKVESVSDLIVVASLIDKLPNLGGMARTSEVFGVNTYVVDSLRHLQDKQFQGLSVSAERWINIEEVRPGRALKEYLLQKKTEGYSVVAAEQTSTSAKLQTFKFPKKTLLLLGHEKEGVPCDLLPIMDHCVEIPQQGYVRSLNVHVTAAIFVWEYARQNVL